MIKVNNISKKYQHTLAVDNISFELNRGDIVGFLGANGAGKSTTIKMITGLIEADSGTISIFDESITEKPIEVKRKIGYLSEDNPLPNEMYVREYLEYVANVYKLKHVKDVVAKSIDDFGLGGEYKKKIAALSKGNRQKLGLAQALIHDPDLLVLDEPTSALDPNQQVEIKEMIAHLSQSKIIFFSTHLLHDLASFTTRVMIIDKGKIVVDKPTENIESVESLFYNISK